MDHSVPASYTVLLLALPAVVFAGRWLARRAWPSCPQVLVGMVSVSGVLLLVHAVARLSHSFRLGLAGGTVALAAVGLGIEFRRRKRERPTGDLLAIDWPQTTWVVATTALIAPLALRFHFHDEVWVTGHMSITSQILNDVYPPRYLEFPDLELRYHYFFDLASAIVGAMTRLPVDRAIDVVTLAGFASTVLALWAVGQRILRGRHALVPLVVLFGFGLPYFATPAGAKPEAALLGYGAAVGGSPLNAPLLSYFFQHPWSLGLPLSCALLLLLLFREGSSAARYAVFAVLLSCLAMSQIVLFACMAGTLLVAEPWERGTSFDRRRAFGMGLAVLTSVAVGLVAGGFFLGSPEGGEELRLRFGVANSLSDSLVWHLVNFGLLLPLGLVGLKRLEPRVRLTVGLLLIGSLSVVNFVSYAHSADILKFATVSTIALALGAAGALEAWTENARRNVRVGGWLATALVTAGGFAVVGALLIGGPGIPPELTLRPARPSADDVAAISWLRRQVRPGEIVCVISRNVGAYYQWGGLPTAYVGAMTPRLGLPKQRIEARLVLLLNPQATPQQYLDQGIRWFVVVDGARNPADGWLTSGEAHEAGRFGALRVVRLGTHDDS